MTVVIARKLGEYISIVSDTMITTPRIGTNIPRAGSDPKLGRKTEDAIPGQLKIITVSDRLSIAYAGLSDQALDAIREVARICALDDLERVREALRQTTVQTKRDGEFKVEFIIASHVGAAELRRVWEGRISGPVNETCIGDGSILPEVLRVFRPTGDDRDDAGTFRADFLGAFTNPRIHAGAGVGGFPLCLEAGPDGHFYKRRQFNYTWKPIEFISGTTVYEDENDLITGEWSFHHAAIAPAAPGAGVIGVAVPQAKLGFVYSPLTEDEPSRVTLLDKHLMWTKHERQMYDLLAARVDKAVLAVRFWRSSHATPLAAI